MGSYPSISVQLAVASFLTVLSGVTLVALCGLAKRTRSFQFYANLIASIAAMNICYLLQTL